MGAGPPLPRSQGGAHRMDGWPGCHPSDGCRMRPLAQREGGPGCPPAEMPFIVFRRSWAMSPGPPCFGEVLGHGPRAGCYMPGIHHPGYTLHPIPPWVHPAHRSSCCGVYCMQAGLRAGLCTAAEPWAQSGKRPWARQTIRASSEDCVSRGMHARARARVAPRARTDKDWIANG